VLLQKGASSSGSGVVNSEVYVTIFIHQMMTSSVDPKSVQVVQSDYDKLYNL